MMILYKWYLMIDSWYDSIIYVIRFYDGLWSLMPETLGCALGMCPNSVSTNGLWATWEEGYTKGRTVGGE